MNGEEYLFNFVQPDDEEQAYQSGYLPQLSQMPLQEPFAGYGYDVQQGFDSMAQPMPMSMSSLFIDGSVNVNEYADPGQLFPEQQVPMMNFASTSQPPPQDDDGLLQFLRELEYSSPTGSSPGSASSSVPSTPASMLFPAEITEGYSPIDTPSPGGSTITFVQDQFQSTTPQTFQSRFRSRELFKMEDGQRKPKQRRACVRCHHGKNKCENAGDGTPCQRCQNLKHECKYSPSRPRKCLPKKGTSVQKK